MRFPPVSITLSDADLDVLAFHARHGHPDRSAAAAAMVHASIECETRRRSLQDIPYGPHTIRIRFTETRKASTTHLWVTERIFRLADAPLPNVHVF